MDSSSNVYGWVDISIHALREEGDFASMRCAVRASNFYPRPPRGGRRPSILLSMWMSQFLSTPSARRATNGHLDLVRLPDISIHALREEGDIQTGWGRPLQSISIHALREEGDPHGKSTTSPLLRFLSTPSARRATKGQGHLWLPLRISIHALREEGDRFSKSKSALLK